MLDIEIDDVCFCVLHMLLRLVEGILKRTAMAVSETLPPSVPDKGTTVSEQVRMNAVELV
jgi:hypothetical protein